MAILIGVAATGNCSPLILPPTTPDPGLLGCYRLLTNLPASYADSLGYELPDVIQLGYSENGQWTVLPTDAEWHPSWTVYDDLPSGYRRRQQAYALARPMQWDSVNHIPGDSIDIRFPSAIGRLTFRLGRQGEDLAGRAEWVVRIDQYFLNDGVRVEAKRSACTGLRLNLRRTRYR